MQAMEYKGVLYEAKTHLTRKMKKAIEEEVKQHGKENTINTICKNRIVLTLMENCDCYALGDMMISYINTL